MIIDAHAHVIPGVFPPDEGFPAMEPIEADTARMLVFGATRFRARAAFFEAESRIDAMDAAGVDQEIVSPMPPLLNTAVEAPLAREISRYVNESVAELVAAGDGRIHGLGMVSLQDPESAAEELGTVQDLGLRGVEVPSNVRGVAIGDARFTEFFREIDRRGLSVFVHTLPRADEPELPAALRGSIGVGIEGARAASSLLFGGMADSCRLDRVLFSHAAGGLPLMLARADYFWSQQDADTRSAQAPSAVARRFFYDSMLFDPRGLRFAVDYLGADRLVLGTDFPAMPRPGVLGATLSGLELSDEDAERIGSANALAFLDLAEALIDVP